MLKVTSSAGGELPAIDVRADEERHDIVRGVGELVGGQLLEEGHELHHVRERVGRERGPPVGGEDRRVGPAPEIVPVRIRHAEQIADDQHRQRRGQHVDQVDDLARRDRVEQLDGQRADLLLHPLDRARGELAVERAPPRAVLGRVHVQDRPGDGPPSRIGSLTSAPRPEQNVAGLRLISRMSW